MFVSTKDKFIFFHIAKTAGSSIHIALKDRYGLVRSERADPPPLIHHIGPEVYLSQHPEHSGYFKFAFVRNPFDRILSAYMEFIQMPHRTNYPLNIHKYNSFEVFCCSFATSAWCLDPHFKKQSELLYKDGNLLVNEVGKFENLQDNLILENEFNLFPYLWGQTNGWHVFDVTGKLIKTAGVCNWIYSEEEFYEQ
jgi:hypothetical protein